MYILSLPIKNAKIKIVFINTSKIPENAYK